MTFDRRRISGLAWSADGGRVIFSSQREQSSSSLWQIAALGGAPELVMAGGKNPQSPAIAPDGKTIAFVEENQDTNIWRYDFDTAGKQISVRKIIASSRADNSPNLSPDGKKLFSFRTERASTEFGRRTRTGKIR